MYDQKISFYFYNCLRIYLRLIIVFRFIQDLVTKDYFQQKPKVILHHVIKLLDHVVLTLDLYNDEEKISCMYNFLYAVIRPAGILESMKLINIIDKWKMHLFKLHIARMQLLI